MLLMDEHLRALCRTAETTEDKLRCARQIVRAGQAKPSLLELTMAFLDPANQENDDIWKAITGVDNFVDLETETWREDLDYDQLQIMDYHTSIVFQGIVSFQVFKFLFTDYPQWMDAIRLTGNNRQKFKRDVWNLVHQLLTWPTYQTLDRRGRGDPRVLLAKHRRLRVAAEYAREIDEWAVWVHERLPDDILYQLGHAKKDWLAGKKGLKWQAIFLVFLLHWMNLYYVI